MKFLCEHCKAKYQIADEKVVGRTVRMKCRKCGGAIEVRAAVTETSVSVKAAEVAAEGEAKPSAPRTAPPKAAPLATSLSSSARTAAPARGASGESALAGAFQRNVQREEEATSAGFDVRELSAADEWYVAVNGVPVGPVRVGEVRRKAAMGAVTEESLCWQEGMEEWRAIRTVTELAAVVREAAMGGRSSALPPEPRSGPPPRPGARATGQHAAVSARESGKAPASPAWASRASTAGMEAQRPADFSEEDAAPTIVGRSPLLEMEAAAAAAAATGHTPRPNGSLAASAAADPFRAPAPDPFRPAVHDPFKPVGAFSASEAAAGAAAFAPVASPVAPPQPIVVTAPPRRFGAIGYGVMLMFACFGTVAAYVVFTKPPPQPIVVNAPAPPTPTAAPVPTDLPAVAPVAPVAAPAPTLDAGAKVASAAPRGAGSPGAVAANTKSTNTAATDPALRDLIAGTGNGPAAGPGGTSGGGGGGAQLTEDEIKAVVSQHNLGVRRTCWDRSSTTTASVNVMVHIVIAGSGQVSQASATGNDPVVAHCLEDEIKRWHWPGGGEVNVPFHFLRQ